MKRKQRRSRGSGRLLTAAGILLILGAMALTGYNLWDQKRAEASSNAALEQLHMVLEAAKAAPVTEETVVSDNGPTTVPTEVTSHGKTEIVYEPVVEEPQETAPASEPQPMKAVLVDGLSYIGILSIPDLGLELPILSQSSVENLKQAPCRYYGSADEGNLILSAHNYRTHFGHLSQLKTGASVSFTDMNGKVYSYQVSAFESLLPSDVVKMKEGQWDLTLYTCNLDQTRRITVRCDRIGS